MFDEKRSRVRGNVIRSSWCTTTLILVMVTFLLTACGGASSSEATPTSESPTATTQPTPTLQMGQVLFAQTISSESVAVDPSPEIPRSATSIYAVVEVANVQPGTSFSAAWTMDGTAIPELASQTTLEAGASTGQLVFQLTWEGAALWPVGVLGVTVTASSGETISGTVQIVST